MQGIDQLFLQCQVKVSLFLLGGFSFHLLAYYEQYVVLPWILLLFSVVLQSDEVTSVLQMPWVFIENKMEIGVCLLFLVGFDDCFFFSSFTRFQFIQKPIQPIGIFHKSGVFDLICSLYKQMALNVDVISRQK